MKKRILLIINPAAGQPEPVLSYINQEFSDKLDWEILITKKDGDAVQFAQKALKENYDILGIYGGDGTLMEVAQTVHKQSLPLLVLPGGTANVMAKELGIPTNTPEALKLVTSTPAKIRTIDMGMINDTPFLIRINIGLAADVVTSASRELKDNLGQLAYSVTTIKHMSDAQLKQFDLQIDGKNISEQGVSLFIANSSNLGIPGVSIIPSVKPDDGWLDVILIKSAGANAVMEWITSSINNTKPTEEIMHWRAKSIQVSSKPVCNVVCDDKKMEITNMNITLIEKAVSIITPK